MSITDGQRPIEEGAEAVLDVLVVGAGFGGLGMASRLKSLGQDRFLILEAADSAGGVWRDNHYPGAACDVPARLYWYGWDQQPDWTRVYAGRDEILSHLQGTIDRYDLDDHLRLSEGVATMAWDADNRVWTITSTLGHTYLSRAVVTAVGQLGTPSYRGIQDRELFRGVQMHSAQWNHDIDLTGKTVAVIGTGASAAQIIPELVDRAGHVLVVQRSAAWVAPRGDREYTGAEREKYQNSAAFRDAEQDRIFAEQEERFESFGLGTTALADLEQSLRDRLRREVADHELRGVLTPDYRLGCKRPIRSDNLLPALASDNVTVVADRVVALDVDGIVTESAQRHRADVVVYATGFESMRFLNGIDVIGSSGVRLHEDAWAVAPQAHLGITVPGFPNFFLLYGPNTNTNNSAVRVMDGQGRYILEALRWVRDGQDVDVRAEVQEEFDRRVQVDCSHLTLTSGCNSWYVNSSGRVVSNWCSTVRSYLDLIEDFSPGDYRILEPLSPLQLEPARI